MTHCSLYKCTTDTKIRLKKEILLALKGSDISGFCEKTSFSFTLCSTHSRPPHGYNRCRTTRDACIFPMMFHLHCTGHHPTRFFPVIDQTSASSVCTAGRIHILSDYMWHWRLCHPSGHHIHFPTAHHDRPPTSQCICWAHPPVWPQMALCKSPRHLACGHICVRSEGTLGIQTETALPRCISPHSSRWHRLLFLANHRT